MDEPLKRKKPATVSGVKNNGSGNQEKLVDGLRDEALIKQFEAAIYSEGIRKKALDVLCKRMASGELSDSMLLRIVVSLAKSTAGLS